MGFYKSVFAFVYHHLMSSRGVHDSDDPLDQEVRIPLLAQAQGDVLEIGAGDGGNLTLYPPGMRLTLLEPNPYMLRYLHQNATHLGINGYEAVESPAEFMPFPDAHFDTVVSTHVLCSVRDQSRVLAEIRRVLRPGGRFLFLEHVAARPDTSAYRWQQRINPVWKIMGDGCHVTRDTGAAIRAAGFAGAEVNDYQADYPSIVSPHVYGWAQA